MNTCLLFAMHIVYIFSLDYTYGFISLLNYIQYKIIFLNSSATSDKISQN